VRTGLQSKLRTFSVSEHKNLILLIVALLAPEIVGFQHLEWWSNGSHHFTFIVSSVTWTLQLSDWWSGVEIPLIGLLFLPYLFTHTMPSSLFLFLMTPVVRLVFVAAVAFYRQNRIHVSILIIACILLIGISIAGCASAMIANVIYGIDPGLEISMLTPDVDTRLFLPIPILLIAGLLFSKKPNLSEMKV
jgi:uncharacterized membrane protein